MILEPSHVVRLSVHLRVAHIVLGGLLARNLIDRHIVRALLTLRTCVGGVRLLVGSRASHHLRRVTDCVFSAYWQSRLLVLLVLQANTHVVDGLRWQLSLVGVLLNHEGQLARSASL